MYFYLVKFACFSNDEVKFYLLDERKYNDWCDVEPPEGYKYFETVWSGEIEEIHSKLNSAKSIAVDDNINIKELFDKSINPCRVPPGYRLLKSEELTESDDVYWHVFYLKWCKLNHSDSKVKTFGFQCARKE